MESDGNVRWVAGNVHDIDPIATPNTNLISQLEVGALYWVKLEFLLQ